MKKECLLWIEKMRQLGEGILSRKVVPLAIHRQDRARRETLHCKSAMDYDRGGQYRAPKEAAGGIRQ
jgi:hypothetical protein